METKIEMLCGFRVHPAANLYPMMGTQELAELARDISRHGQIRAVTLIDGAILDGRSRVSACELAGVEPITEEWQDNGQSPTEWVLSNNSIRRHLTPSQKAAVAVAAILIIREESLARQTLGKELPKVETGKTVEKAAALTGANPEYVRQAAKLQEESPEEFEKVKAGLKTLSAARRETAPRPSAAPAVSTFQAFRETITSHYAKNVETQTDVETLKNMRDHYILMASNIDAKLSTINAA